MLKIYFRENHMEYNILFVKYCIFLDFLSYKDTYLEYDSVYILRFTWLRFNATVRP